MHSEVLGEAITRAKADANISSLVGTKVFNFVDPNTSPPYLRIQLEDVSDMGQKDGQLVEGNLRFDYWTEYEGDAEVLDMINYITDEFHQSELSLSEGSTNLLMTRESYNVFLEGDGDTRHGIVNFSIILEN